MKKLILFISIILLSFAASAQKAISVPALDFNTGWFTTYTGAASDTLNATNATTWSYEVPVNKFDGIFFVYQIKLADKTTGANGRCTLQSQGKYFDGGEYANIGSQITWTGVGSTDSTITITSISSKVYYPYIRLLVTNVAGKSKVVSNKLVIKR